MQREQCHAQGLCPARGDRRIRAMSCRFRRRQGCGRRDGRSLAAAVGDDAAIADLDHPGGTAGHLRIVRDDDHRVPLGIQFRQQTKHFLAAGCVQRAGRLVGQDHRAAIHQGPRDRYALLLPAGELARPVVRARAQPQALQQQSRAGLALLRTAARVDGRKRHVVLRCQLSEKLVALEDKAEMLAPQPRQSVRVQVRHFLPGHPVAARGRAVQRAEDVHEGGFARTRGAHDGHHLSRLDAQVDAVEHGDRALPGRELPPQAAHLQQGPARGYHGAGPWGVGASAAASPITTRSPGSRPRRICTFSGVRSPVRTSRLTTSPFGCRTRTVPCPAFGAG